MRLLAVETGTDQCSVALCDGNKLVTRCDQRARVHAKRVLAMSDECLQEAGCAVADVDAIVFGRGPGSFTGLRIAASVAHGLALGAALPVIPISSLAGHAAAAWRSHDVDKVAVAVDARMAECYWGCYRVRDGVPLLCGVETIGCPADLPELDGSRWFGTGTGWERYPELGSRHAQEMIGIDATLLPEARDLIASAKLSYDQGKFMAPEEALPVYLRERVTDRS